jgi:hypothetical protein
MARRKKALEGGTEKQNIVYPPEDPIQTHEPTQEEEKTQQETINLNRMAIIAGTLLSFNLRIGSSRILTDLYRFYQVHGCVLDSKNVERARKDLKSVLTSTDKQESVDKEMDRIMAFLNLMLDK